VTLTHNVPDGASGQTPTSAIVQLGAGKLVKLPVHVVLQVFASTTVAVYVPLVLTLNTKGPGPLCEGGVAGPGPLKLTVNGPLPPVTLTVKFPEVASGQTPTSAIVQLGDGKLVKLPVHVVVQVLESVTLAV